MKKSLYELSTYVFNEQDTNNHLIGCYVAVLGETPSLYETIDEVYNKHPERYQHAAKESSLYTYFYVTNGGIYREIYAKKILGILLYGFKHDPSLVDWVWELSLKKWATISKLITSCTEIDDDVWADIVETMKKSEQNAHFSGNMQTILEKSELFAFEKFPINKIDIGHGMHKSLILATLFAILQNKAFQETSEIADNFGYVVDFLIKQTEDMEEVNFEKAKSSREKSEMNALKKFLFDRNQRKQEAVLKEVDDGQYITIQDAEFDASEVHFIFNLAKHYSGIEMPSVFRYYSKKDLEKRVKEGVFECLYLRPKDYAKSTHFVYMFLMFSQLMDQLKETKEYYFKHYDEQMIQNESVESSEMERLQEEMEALRQQNAQLQDELAKRTKQVKDMQKEHETELYNEKRSLKKAEKHIKKLEKEQEELPFYREFHHYYQQEQDSQTDQTVTEEDVEFVNEQHIMVIGGKENWVHNLLQRVDVETVHYEQMNLNVDSLHKADMIFFNTNYLNHSLFYKTINELRKHKIPFGFLNKTNVEYNILEMVEQCKSRSRKQTQTA